MSTPTQQEYDAALTTLMSLRLPDLQRRYAEAVGKPTKAPNKKFLAISVINAEMGLPEEGGASASPKENPSVESVSDLLPDEETPTTTEVEPLMLRELDVPQLRELYAARIGRPTSSLNKTYLIWKLREAEKGRVRVGPRRSKKSDEPHKVLPLRLPTKTVEAIDEAWRRQGMLSRMDFIRKAMKAYLLEVGEPEVAGMLE